MRLRWLLLLALLLPSQAWAAVAIVAAPETVCNVGTSSSPTCAYDTAVSSGNTLVAMVVLRTTQTDTGISDSVNGAWTCPAGANYSDGSAKVMICYFNNTGAGTPTLTLSLGGNSATYWNLTEWSGVANSSPEDGTSEGADAATPFSAGAGLTSTSAGLITCVFGAGANFTGGTPATGFTNLTNNALRDWFEYRIGSATTTDCASSLTGPGGTIGAMLALKEEAAAGAETFGFRLRVVQ